MNSNASSEIMRKSKPVFIFFHIPKCAGTSIKASLGVKERVVSVNEDRSLSWRQGIYKRFGWDSFPGFENIYTFTIVRNPWDRAVSAWKNKNPHRHSTLSDYLRHPFLSPSQLTKLNDIQFARQASYEWHNLPQWDCISWQGQIVVKEVFRFENLQEDWKTIQKKTEVNASLLHLTRSNRDDYRQYYDEETYRCIEKRYEKDIQTFGYTFG